MKYTKKTMQDIIDNQNNIIDSDNNVISTQEEIISGLEKQIKLLESLNGTAEKLIELYKPNNLGCKVVVTFKNQEVAHLHNVTEIHYNYLSPLGHKIAFESDIHGTGINYYIRNISEFQTSSETEEQEKF